MSAILNDNQRTIFARLVEALGKAGNTHRISDVMRALRHGEAQTWLGANDSIAVTEVMRYPGRCVACIWLAAGHLDDLLPLLPRIEAWAREQGATMIEATARRGWLPVAKAAGFSAEAIVYRKDI